MDWTQCLVPNEQDLQKWLPLVDTLCPTAPRGSSCRAASCPGESPGWRELAAPVASSQGRAETLSPTSRKELTLLVTTWMSLNVDHPHSSVRSDAVGIFPWVCVSYWKIFQFAKPDLMAMLKGQGQGSARKPL